jgi:hypothetical protein
MSKPESTTLVPVAYEDFSEAQRKAAIEKDLKSIRADEVIVQRSRTNVKREVVNYLNACIRQGDALIRICGHQQVNFAFVKDMEARLPWGESTKEALEIAQSRVALAKRFEGQIKSYEDISLEFRKGILQQVELLTHVERQASDSDSEPIERFATWMAGISRFKQDLLKCWDEKPLEKRSPAQLKSFLSDTEWLALERNRAKELLWEK